MNLQRLAAPLLALAVLAACSDDSSGPSRVPASITVAFDTLSFGATVPAALIVKDQNGATIDAAELPDGITLESSDTTVATANSDDLTVTATGIGESVITARYGSIEATGTLPVRVGPKPAQLLAAGDDHNCHINAAGTTVCWGVNDDGQLGSGDFEPDASGVPLTVTGNHTFTTLSAGYHTCALENGEAWCWGGGGEGGLGNGADTSSANPVKVAGGHTFAQISVGWGHVCALTAEGRAYCWGYNEDGEVGNGTESDLESEPIAVDTDARFAQLVASGDHSCGLTRLGKVYCWGYSNGGTLGTGDDVAQSLPVAVLDSLTLVEIGGTYMAECGLDRTGRAICWGYNEDGQVGDGGSADEVYSPREVDSNVRFASLGSATEDTFCAIERGSGNLYCWGEGNEGQIGDGGTDDAFSPTRVASFQAKAVSAGEDHACAIDLDDDIYCWGSNEYGQIGNGSLGEEDDPVLSPSKVDGLDGVAALRLPGSMMSRTPSAPRAHRVHRR